MSPDAAFKPVSIFVGFLLPYCFAPTILRQKKTAKRIICEITGIIRNACSYIIQGNSHIFLETSNNITKAQFWWEAPKKCTQKLKKKGLRKEPWADPSLARPCIWVSQLKNFKKGCIIIPQKELTFLTDLMNNHWMVMQWFVDLLVTSAFL